MLAMIGGQSNVRRRDNRARGGGVVVEDGVDRLTGRDLTLDGVQEADEFLMAVAPHAAADAPPARRRRRTGW